MSASDDDLREALTRAAGRVDAPGDPVGRVRAEVGRRRRRRSRARLGAGSAVAAAVLVGAVVVVPDQVLPDGLRDGRPRDPAPPAGEPSGGASDRSADSVLLQPDGFEGLRLGEPVVGLDETTLMRGTDGCEGTVLSYGMRDVEVLGDAAAGATYLEVWVRDGVLVQIVLGARAERVELPGDTPRTWLGPTLRDPLAAALELDGAQLVADDPLGDEGPPVTNVVVPSDGGGEIVFTDVPVDGQPSQGQVNAVVLRDPAGRGCGFDPASFGQPGEGLPDQVGSVALTELGLAGVRLRSSAAEAVATGALVAGPSDGFEDPLDGRGCTLYRSVPDGLSVWAEGDEVVAVGSLGFGPRFQLNTEVLSVVSGQRFDDLAADVPAGGTTTVASPVAVPGGVSGEAVDLLAGPGVRARVVGVQSGVVAATTGLGVGGPALVDGVLLYLGDEPADSLCRADT